MVLQPVQALRRCSAFVRNRTRRVARILWLRRLKNKTFTLISNDCWGGEVYRDFNLPYHTPFVGLMMMAPCYIRLLENLRENLASPLAFVNASRYEHLNENRRRDNHFYPIGLLNGDIEIHFLHYASSAEAHDKWTRRAGRMHWDNLFVKFDAGKDCCTNQLLAAYEALPFARKVCFGAERKERVTGYVYTPRWTSNGKALYKASLPDFDVVDWLNGGTGEVTGLHRLLLKGLKGGRQ